MKYISLFILLIACQAGLMAQKITEAEVPTAVKNSFSNMFKNTTVSQWELEEGKYEAEYKSNGTEHRALFAADGKFVQYENHVTYTDLPEEARKYMTTHYPNKKIGDVTQIKLITGGVSYEVEAGDEDYIFDANGNFVKMEQDTDNDDQK